MTSHYSWPKHTEALCRGGYRGKLRGIGAGVHTAKSIKMRTSMYDTLGLLISRKETMLQKPAKETLVFFSKSLALLLLPASWDIAMTQNQCLSSFDAMCLGADT